jgi:hypothetical protein
METFPIDSGAGGKRDRPVCRGRSVDYTEQSELTLYFFAACVGC